MNGKIIYSFQVYLQNPHNPWHNIGFGSTVTGIAWDTMITLFGSNLDEALKTMPEEFEGYAIYKVDYPLGWPHFPLFPPSICTAGAVGVDMNGNHYLRKV